ncbi:MAG: YeeE/YedE family protein [Myxococcota bacterium]|nr:YeeE/YedE family protein [Myxococcota bacterium]
MQGFTPVSAFGGGLLIGLAALWMLVFQGRVAGISGICGGLFGGSSRAEWSWRVAFVAGLLVVGVTAESWAGPAVLQYGISRSPAALVVAGLLVGFGTRLGGGCTSGHGICGLGRFSLRSAAATGTFMGVGMLTAAVLTHAFGGEL